MAWQGFTLSIHSLAAVRRVTTLNEGGKTCLILLASFNKSDITFSVFDDATFGLSSIAHTLTESALIVLQIMSSLMNILYITHPETSCRGRGLIPEMIQVCQ